MIKLNCISKEEISAKIAPNIKRINVDNISYIENCIGEYRTKLIMNSGHILFTKYNISQVEKKLGEKD